MSYTFQVSYGVGMKKKKKKNRFLGPRLIVKNKAVAPLFLPMYVNGLLVIFSFSKETENIGKKNIK